MIWGPAYWWTLVGPERRAAYAGRRLDRSVRGGASTVAKRLKEAARHK